MSDASRIWLVGDISLAGDVEEAAKAVPGYDPWVRLRGTLGGGLVIGNVECVLAAEGDPIPGKYAHLRAESQGVQQLARLDVAVLANNHVSDFGEAAAEQTKHHLESAGITTVGYGANIDEASQPLVIERSGVRVGLMAFSCLSTNGLNYATPDGPGVAPLSMAILRSRLASVRPRVDCLLVYLHWGVEYCHFPTADQMRLARRAIDWGADAVIGVHPHVVQGYERYRSGHIFYSLGNFLFADVPWQSMAPDGRIHRGVKTMEKSNRQSLAVCMSFHRGSQRVGLDLEKVLPVEFDAQFVPAPISRESLTFDLDDVNRQIWRYAKRHWKSLAGEAEIEYRAVCQGGFVAYYYCSPTIDHRPAGRFLPSTRLGRWVRRELRFVSRKWLGS